MPADDTEALVLAYLAAYQDEVLTALQGRADDPREAIGALVRLHLSWTETDPERARLVAVSRAALAAGPRAGELTGLNRRFFGAIGRWLNADASGALRALPLDVIHALVFAPAQEICRAWLDGRSAAAPTTYADQLAAAAWAGLIAAGQTSPPTG